jgi:SNF2 family DNA or RNA helicase
VPALAAAGWKVSVDTDLPFNVQDVQAFEPTWEPVAGKQDWFGFSLGATVGSGASATKISLAPVIAQIINAGGFEAWKGWNAHDGEATYFPIGTGQYVRLPFARLEPLVRVVADWVAERGGALLDEAPQQFEVPSMAAALALGAADAWTDVAYPTTGGAAVPPLRHAVPERLANLGRELHNFSGIEAVSPPASFQGTLRPYQLHGLAWLQFLAKNGLGGVLADDMGLGKTVQALAHIAKEHATKRQQAPVLVVAPTSLIFNWQAEATRYAPVLKVLALVGKERAKDFAAIRAHDIVLTTYALLPRDGEALAKEQWHAVILDEAQHVKNTRTKAAQWVRSLNATHRIALTGTPMENHLGELWSVMDFAVPGLFGEEKRFRSHFRNPIENISIDSKPHDQAIARDRQAALKTRLKPFVLRRTKEQVAAELPAKTEIIRTAALEGAQRDLYETVRAAMDERVRKALAQSGLAKSHIVVLDALLKLRQVCCDPALVNLPAARGVSQSAKLELLLDLLPALQQEGRTVLLFSQFTSMLDRIESALDAHADLKTWPRARLDGDMPAPKRRDVVAQFQSGGAKLFLLSLKAGGVGLNLTAADTVIHYDPWWNPAVERQATDRAHRIGQDKPVFIYKLLTAGTVEEKISAMQARKAELAAAVLSEDGAGFAKAITKDDLDALFAA